jgi:hypothetical protein
MMGVDRGRVPPGTTPFAMQANDITDCPWSPTSDDPQERTAWRLWQHRWADHRRPLLEGHEAFERATDRARAYGLSGEFVDGMRPWGVNAARLAGKRRDPVDDLLANPGYDVGPEVDLSEIGRAMAATFGQSMQDLARAVEDALAALQPTLAVVADVWNSLSDDVKAWLNEPPAETHTIRGKPAGRVKYCHHGNPRGRCPTCSGVGTPAPRNHR